MVQNPIRWFEIYVKNMKRAKSFYQQVFNVEFSQLPFSEGEMWAFPSNPEKWGCSGTLVHMPGLEPSGVSTIVYFGSDDCSKEEKRILSAGGTIHKSKMSIGQYGYIVLAIDTEGNMIGVHSMN